MSDTPYTCAECGEHFWLHDIVDENEACYCDECGSKEPKPKISEQAEEIRTLTQGLERAETQISQLSKDLKYWRRLYDELGGEQ